MEPIVDIFRTVVAKVSEALLDSLQVVDPMITGVHYLHGHPKEIIETLRQKDQVPEYRFEKYPLIALFQDFPETKGAKVGIESEARLHLIIARATRPEYKAEERYAENFIPVLYPVYYELLRQIHLAGAFMTLSPNRIPHTKIDRLYWGREGLYGNQANIFGDWIDCIEIRDMRINLTQKTC